MQIPAHMQDEYDALTAAQKSAFGQLVQMSAAGSPGNLIISFAAFENAMKSVQRMGPEPDQPIEPDKSVNHDWPANFIPKKR
jgi:hypothetical protein